MIATILATLLCLPASEVIEAPVAGARVVVAQALFPAEGLGRRDGAAVRVLGATLLDGTADFSAPDLLRYGSQAGAAPEVETGPDFIRVTVTAPQGAADLAGQLLEQIVTRPSLRDEDLAASLADLRGERPRWLSQALDPVSPDWDRVRMRDVRELHLRLFRPERMVLVLAGAIGPGDVAGLAARFGQWRPAAPPRPVSDPPQRPRTKVEGDASVAELAGSPIAPSDATSLMAVVALGAGKGSAMHRVMRVQGRESYFQQAVLWPTAKGWSPRLIWAHAGTVDFEKARAGLLADVERWTEDDAGRARAFLGACLDRGLEATPFASGPAGWLRSDVRGAADWAGLMALMGSRGLARRTLLDALANVDAEAIRAKAATLVRDADARLLPGGG